MDTAQGHVDDVFRFSMHRMYFKPMTPGDNIAAISHGSIKGVFHCQSDMSKKWVSPIIVEN